MLQSLRPEFKNLSAEKFLSLAMPLLAEHRDELATDKGLMVLNPDVETYLALESTGALMVIGVFSGSELIGYSASVVTRNLHYSDLVIGQNDVIWIKPDYRKGPLGLKLIRETERQAKEAGAQLMLWHTKPGTSLDKIMPRLGATVQDTIWKVNL